MPRAAQGSHGQDGSDATNTPYPDPLKTLIWNAVLEKATDVHLHSVDGGSPRSPPREQHDPSQDPAVPH